MFDRCTIGKSTISMTIFNGYVKLPGIEMEDVMRKSSKFYIGFTVPLPSLIKQLYPPCRCPPKNGWLLVIQTSHSYGLYMQKFSHVVPASTSRILHFGLSDKLKEPQMWEHLFIWLVCMNKEKHPHPMFKHRMFDCQIPNLDPNLRISEE